MPVLFSRRPEKLLGIDISSSAVKVLELGVRGSLENYRISRLPRGASLERGNIDAKVVADTLQQALAQMNTRLDVAAVAVPDSAVMKRTLAMSAALNPFQLEEQILAEAGRYLPFPVHEAAIDFIRKPARAGCKQVDVLLFACRREAVDIRVKALKQAGLRTSIVDIEPCAMERAYGVLMRQCRGALPQTGAMMDIGASAMRLYVLRRGETFYCHEHSWGGGLPVHGLETSAAWQHPAPARDIIVQQVSRALQFYYSSEHDCRLEQLVLAGGVAAMPGLAADLQVRLDMPVSVAAPFSAKHCSSVLDPEVVLQDSPALMSCLGLALSAPG